MSGRCNIPRVQTDRAYNVVGDGSCTSISLGGPVIVEVVFVMVIPRCWGIFRVFPPLPFIVFFYVI